MGFGIRFEVAILPVLGETVAIAVVASNLIAFAVYYKNHSNGTERGRNDEDQNSALQCLNHASASGRCLSVAEGAALRKGRHSGQQQDESRQPQP